MRGGMRGGMTDDDYAGGEDYEEHEEETPGRHTVRTQRQQQRQRE